VDDIDYEISKLKEEQQDLESQEFHFSNFAKGIIENIKHKKEDWDEEKRFMEGLKFRDQQHKLVHQHLD
jgi:hypothetical protein